MGPILCKSLELQEKCSKFQLPRFKLLLAVVVLLSFLEGLTAEAPDGPHAAPCTSSSAARCSPAEASSEGSAGALSLEASSREDSDEGPGGRSERSLSKSATAGGTQPTDHQSAEGSVPRYRVRHVADNGLSERSMPAPEEGQDGTEGLALHERSREHSHEAPQQAETHDFEQSAVAGSVGRPLERSSADPEVVDGHLQKGSAVGRLVELSQERSVESLKEDDGGGGGASKDPSDAKRLVFLEAAEHAAAQEAGETSVAFIPGDSVTEGTKDGARSVSSASSDERAADMSGGQASESSREAPIKASSEASPDIAAEDSAGQSSEREGSPPPVPEGSAHRAGERSTRSVYRFGQRYMGLPEEKRRRLDRLVSRLLLRRREPSSEASPEASSEDKPYKAQGAATSDTTSTTTSTNQTSPANMSGPNPQQTKEEANRLYALAETYMFGKGVKVDYQLAHHYYNQSVALGSQNALFALGLLSATGLGTDFSQATAMRQYLAAHKTGSVNAHLALAALMSHDSDDSLLRTSCSSAASFYRAVAYTALVSNFQRGTREPPKNVYLSNLTAVSMARKERQSKKQVLENLETGSQGSPWRKLALGQTYRFGLMGADRDPARAVQLFQEAARQGQGMAHLHLGEMYEHGIGVPVNTTAAHHHYSQAAEQGVPAAHDRIGQMYLNGKVVERNLTEAKRRFELAAARMYDGSAYNLGRLYKDGTGVERDHGYAAELFLRGAKVRHINSMYALGDLLLDSNTKANRLFGIASYASNITLVPQAMFCTVGAWYLRYVASQGPWNSALKDGLDAYLDGRVEVALSYYIHAAELGFQVAQSNAAWLLQRHPNILKNRTHSEFLAIHYLKRAAAHGDLDARVRLGDVHYYGSLGTPKNETAALEHYLAAGNARSPWLSGVFADIDTALLPHLEPAEESQYTSLVALARFNVAFMYHFGEGVHRSYSEAMRWYNMSRQADSAAYWPSSLAQSALELRHQRDITFLQLRLARHVLGDILSSDGMKILMHCVCGFLAGFSAVVFLWR